MTSVTRKQAKAEGLRFYNGGKPCKHCGAMERYTSGGCVSCSTARKTKNRKKMTESRAGLLYVQGRPCRKNPEHIDADGTTKRYKDGECVACKNFRDNTSNSSWVKKYPEKNAEKAARYRARKRAGEVTLTPEEKQQIKALYAEARRLTKETEIIFTVEHIFPLEQGGLHHPINLTILTKSENSAKQDKIIPDLITPENLTLHREKGLLHNIHIIGKF